MTMGKLVLHSEEWEITARKGIPKDVIFTACARFGQFMTKEKRQKMVGLSYSIPSNLEDVRFKLT